jgi:hypothetical protein
VYRLFVQAPRPGTVGRPAATTTSSSSNNKKKNLEDWLDGI